MELQEKMNFANRFELEKLIGKGEQTEVWLAKDQWSNESVALKIYATREIMEESGVNGLVNSYNLNHQNLLLPERADNFDRYATMKYCSKGSCAGLIGRASEEQIIELLSDVASALAFLHGKGLAHGNLKPTNVLLSDEGSYVLVDMTKASPGYGSMGCDSKEAIQEDIKSLGGLCFQLIEGRMPDGTMRRDDISDALKHVVEKLLQGTVSADALAKWAENELSNEEVEEEEENEQEQEEEEEVENEEDTDIDGVCDDSDFDTTSKEDEVPHSEKVNTESVNNKSVNNDVQGRESAKGWLVATFIFGLLGGYLGLIFGLIVFKNKKYKASHRMLGLIGAIIAAFMIFIYQVLPKL